VLLSVSQRTAVLMCAVAIVLTPASEAAGAVAAQEAVRTSGDAASRASVEARTRPIYEAATQHGAHHVFALVRDSSVGPDGSLGTEATGVVLDRAIGRIVASSWTATGKYSVEYYRARDSLLMAYETFVYFDETAPKDHWRNFMGLTAWERRTYFDDHQVLVFAESRGAAAPAPGTDAARLRGQADRLASLLLARVE
jgi:hypothetical protein